MVFPGGGLDANQVLPGFISQINLYDYAMPDDMVLQMNMFCEEEGNVVNEDTFTEVGTVPTETEEKECKPCTLGAGEL